MKQRNWSKVSSVVFMITPWKFLDSMLKTMKTGGISHEFWPFFVYFGLHPFTFSHLFCFMASLGEDSLSKWSIIWMQPCAACHLMLLDVAKEFNHWNYGISKSNWIQNSSPTQKKHKIIHSETSLQHEKKQNNKETSIKPIISSLLPSRKTHQNLSKCKIHSLPSKEKKNYPK